MLPSTSQPLLRGAVAVCLFETAYFAAYHFGMSFSQVCAAPFWFPDSILLCALLVIRRRYWWIPIAAALPVRLFSPVAAGIPPWFLLATFGIDTAKAVLTALLLRRFGPKPLRFETVKDFAQFCLWAVLLVPAASAFAGAWARQSGGHEFWPAWEQWFLGDALTQLVVTPVLFYWVLTPAWTGALPTAKRRLEAGLLAAGLVVAGYLAFGPPAASFAESRFYAPAPFLFWAAIRFGMPGATGATAAMAVLSVEAALAGRGPFAGDSPAEMARSLQNFLLLRAAPIYLVAILVEQRERVERQLQEQREQLAYLARVVVLGELSGSLAHELGQPLSAILNNAQAAQLILARGNVDLDELREMLGDIVADDRRAGEIIRSLRQLFTRGTAEWRPIDMNQLVMDSLKIAQGELTGASVELRTELAEGLPAISGDPVQLKQLLLNLISNACNAMTSIHDRRLTVSTRFYDGEGVRVTVSDRGHGIADGNLRRIFEPFFTTSPDGMGLGLEVCRTIAGAHRGKLWAENNADQGASFHFSLPQGQSARAAL